MKEWQASKKELLCDTCNGEGETACPLCHGSGVDQDHKTPCTNCDGTGSAGPCKKCNDGFVPCPAPCLKESDFAGKPKNPEGKRIKTWKPGAASGWVSDAHIGQPFVKEGDHYELVEAECPVCGGKSVIVCPTSNGKNIIDCKTCHGLGYTGPACPQGASEKVECEICKGNAIKAS